MKKRIKSKNYNKWKTIDALAIFAICILSLLCTHISGVVQEEFSYYTGDPLYIIVLIICTIPTFLEALAVYVGIRFTIKKVKKKNLTYNVTVDIPYYRDCIEGLTPYEVSILADLDIEESKDIAATILWYQNKNYIDIKNEQIICKDNLNLTEKDKYFLTYLNTKDVGYLDAYKNMTFEELIQKGYIENNNKKLSIFKNTVIRFLLFFLILCLILINVFFIKDLIVEKIIDIIIICLIAIIIYKRASALLIGYVNRKSKYRRTKLGDEKTEYIHALQNFIHDFSNLKDVAKEQIVLWEDFLVYAIILEENSKIVKEIEDIFKDKHSQNIITTIMNIIN